MKKLILTLLVMVSAALTAMADADIIVMNDGTVINAYNLDYSSKDKCYYSGRSRRTDEVRQQK